MKVRELVTGEEIEDVNSVEGKVAKRALNLAKACTSLDNDSLHLSCDEIISYVLNGAKMRVSVDIRTKGIISIGIHVNIGSE